MEPKKRLWGKKQQKSLCSSLVEKFSLKTKLCPLKHWLQQVSAICTAVFSHCLLQVSKAHQSVICWAIDRLYTITRLRGKGEGRGSSIPMSISVSLGAWHSDDAHTTL